MTQTRAYDSKAVIAYYHYFVEQAKVRGQRANELELATCQCPSRARGNIPTVIITSDLSLMFKYCHSIVSVISSYIVSMKAAITTIHPLAMERSACHERHA